MRKNIDIAISRSIVPSHAVRAFVIGFQQSAQLHDSSPRLLQYFLFEE